MIVRLVAVLVTAGLLGIQVVRNAAAAILAPTKPNQAAQLWAGNPAVELSLAMTQIAEATRAGREVPATAFSLTADAAAKEPLAPEPFLVHGVQAQLAGDGTAAQRAFEAAQWRDPRSLPAAYFLADRYFHAGKVDAGLREISALARLSPSGIAIVAPYVADYAHSRANWPAIRTLLRANPDLAQLTLTLLGGDAATAPAVLALADPHEKARDAQWLPQLLRTLTSSGRYGDARAIWERMTGARLNGSLYDSELTDKVSPPPFNWALTSSAVGLAERQPGGRLHVIFYGREDGFLATQMLLLTPGAYRLSMRVLGEPERARTLNWSVWCDDQPAPVASSRLDSIATQGFAFKVPAGCQAQWLKLTGASTDVPQQSDVTIEALKLEKVSGA